MAPATGADLGRARVVGTVVRAGFAPMKGARHLRVDPVTLDVHGPVGDREWCLVDVARSQVLRTVGHRTPVVVVTVGGASTGVVVTAAMPDGRRVTQRVGDGRALRVDYWGRPAEVTAYDGAVGELMSQFLGRSVVLARATRGHVVYGAPVSLIGTASISELAARMSRPDLVDQTERFRSTFVIDTEEPWIEDTWLARELMIGTATVQIESRIGRCAVPNMHPVSGVPDAAILKELAAYRPVLADGTPCAGVDAVVVEPGIVGDGSHVVLQC